MLEKPQIPDEEIISRLEEEYELRAGTVKVCVNEVRCANRREVFGIKEPDGLARLGNG